MNNEQLSKTVAAYYKRHNRHQFHTIKSVKESLQNGEDIRWINDGYKCYVDNDGIVLVVYTRNGFTGRLTYQEVCCCYVKN